MPITNFNRWYQTFFQALFKKLIKLSYETLNLFKLLKDFPFYSPILFFILFGCMYLSSELFLKFQEKSLVLQKQNVFALFSSVLSIASYRDRPKSSVVVTITEWSSLLTHSQGNSTVAQFFSPDWFKLAGLKLHPLGWGNC